MKPQSTEDGQGFQIQHLALDTWPRSCASKINAELMKSIIIRVKYQESRIGCENLAYFQSIENKCKLNMTKIYLGKRQIGSIK